MTMPNTLSDGSATVFLPSGMQWQDRHAWSPVVQSVETGLTGAKIVQAAALLDGRPITLAPADGDTGWMTRDDVVQMELWAATPLQQLSLALDGSTYNVIFRHHEEPALSAAPVVPYDDPADTDPYLVTAKFMVIE